MQFQMSIQAVPPPAALGSLYGTRGTPTDIILVGMRRGVCDTPPRATALVAADHQVGADARAGVMARWWPGMDWMDGEWRA